MNCVQLAECVQQLHPQSQPADVARLCLLLYNYVPDRTDLEDQEKLKQACADLNIRLQAATDQHLAVTDELQQMAKSDPRNFSPDQIWVLVRAINVQSQVLQMYNNEAIYELS